MLIITFIREFNMLSERYKKQLEGIKAHLLLRDVIPDMSAISHSTCPFCGKQGKWKIKDRGDRGICYSSKCVIRSLNKHGICDVISAYRLITKDSAGTLIPFVKAVEDLDKIVTGKLGLVSSISNVLDLRHKVVSPAWQTFTKELNSKHGNPGMEYLLKRGFKESIISELGIGYASNNTLRRNTNLCWEDLYQHKLVDSNSGREFFWESVIFPVRDIFGRFIHLQGRSICSLIPKDENGDDKWPRYKATISVLGVPNIDMYMFLEQKLGLYRSSGNPVFVCEGVPDAISLYQSGGNSVGIFGTHGLARNVHKLEGIKDITIIGDNDRYDVDHPYYAGLYKSWERLIPQIITLQLACPDSRVSIFIPPTNLNCVETKDINDMLKSGLEGEELIHYIMTNRVGLSKFLIDNKFDDVDYHLDILKVVKIAGVCKEELECLILDKYGSFMNYLTSVIAN